MPHTPRAQYRITYKGIHKHTYTRTHTHTHTQTHTNTSSKRLLLISVILSVIYHFLLNFTSLTKLFNSKPFSVFSFLLILFIKHQKLFYVGFLIYRHST